MSSSSSSPQFLTFLINNDQIDAFGQPSSFNMQIYTTPDATNDPKHGSIFFGRWPEGRIDEGIWSPYAKFEAVQAASRGGMVHLKSSYNQKYLRRASEDPNNPDIAAVADEPEEDISKWSCTLFRINSNDQTLEIRYNRRMWKLNAEHSVTLRTGIWLRVNDGIARPDHIIYTRFEQYDLDMLPTLPTQICFKADNDQYLKVVRPAANQTIRAMFTGDDPREPEAQFRVVPTRLRTVVLVPVAFPNTYLVRTSNGYVASTSTIQTNRRNALLEPVRIDFDFEGPAVVSFRSVPHPKRHLMVRRESDDAFTDSDKEIGIVAQAEFLIEDTIRARELSNVEFLYSDMKISNPNPVLVLTKNVVNKSMASSQEAHMEFKYKEYRSNHWETTHSWHVGMSADFSVSVSASIPVIKFGVEATASVGVETGYQEEHKIGETKVEESEMLTSLTVEVPPRTQSFVHMTVSRAKIQLPYNYTQREVRQDGSSVANKKVDGFYEGEATHVDYQVEERSL